MERERTAAGSKASASASLSQGATGGIGSAGLAEQAELETGSSRTANNVARSTGLNQERILDLAGDRALHPRLRKVSGLALIDDAGRPFKDHHAVVSTHRDAAGQRELGKEVAIAAQRLGCRVIACDRYAAAPAMQVADVAEVLPMTDADALLEVVRRHQPDVVIPEIEALAVHALAELEQEESP